MSIQPSLFDIPPPPPHPFVVAFFTYHKKHPEVWELFQKFTWQAIHSGRQRFSTHAIVNRIRWETTINYTSGNYEGEEFKISNNAAGAYSRMFMQKFPEHEGFFQVKPCVFDDVELPGEKT
jgi:hypothetical protein